ncbi:MAG TPA: ATP-binding cassette domain-containing protein [Bacteroidales bacterium]|jgi:phospholipid/cholesterol/gamma-HCH transport system ATP-binding protein|nr:ATP-binding cassette domain-containing protein [Bacteroidales bacterium]OQB61331.1 MAG: Methionine import ATP-binding protein MetN [Bacteroidetes bacterium ADurb.Bin145]NMD04090.1 ATP-binding cassette domain-containing protein [Bacteroidales bacterium]HOU02060.1 ATP-binding cassette domain-containing protein [Bacteroidales bacterium]HQG62609.1 ATP-binding cassette domain-containing protein [Bacteroidales bacterium]
MIKVNNLDKVFDGRLVLDNISVTFESGKTNLIIGRSGSGKTVLLKSIVGLHDPDRGEVWFEDVLFNKLDFEGKKKIRAEMGMLFQGSALFDSLTVEQNVRFPLDMFTGKTMEEKTDRVNFCLKRVNIINANKLFPSELSGGMKKRVAIARAISLNPKYLFCDEPNSGLDPLTAILIDELIKELTEEYSMTTIVNTHDMNSVIEIGEKIVFIHEGLKCWEGTNKEILNSDCETLNDFVFANSLAKQLKGIAK